MVSFPKQQLVMYSNFEIYLYMNVTVHDNDNNSQRRIICVSWRSCFHFIFFQFGLDYVSLRLLPDVRICHSRVMQSVTHHDWKFWSLLILRQISLSYSRKKSTHPWRMGFWKFSWQEEVQRLWKSWQEVGLNLRRSSLMIISTRM